MSDADIVVIGAGLAGLTLARQLANAGRTVVIVEKSKSPGGRLSTRRSAHGAFDHGAQYLTCRTPEFTGLINQLSQTGDMAKWQPGGKDRSGDWWVGQPSMSALGKALARPLDIRFKTRAMRIEKQTGHCLVHAETEGGSPVIFSASRVIAAIPAPQAFVLLGPLDPAFSPLNQVGMAPCWTAMLAFEAPLPGVPDLLRGRDGSILSLIVRNGTKPGRSGETFVLHATPQWSRAQMQAGPDSVRSAMLEAMRIETGLGADLPTPVHFETHRWLHALVEKPLGKPFIGNADDTLFACGDWCIAARAESAHQSGLALAHHIISL
ncbi:NAD(P)/FAD-dependent oxidoreductase [Hoeflea ulvae]|uniref:FAD-dependent oxidoreductase n=1 Tax=Hoeflea ulvae TaxID=2983764 RepID=A0ABT3YL68_9HYPH|nr:FAD-dependent oxidoreductase [Hoeflea ulvae]MCY0096622.1 FAD-dependent oxidoreductase [Hoeflea ulvae]